MKKLLLTAGIVLSSLFFAQAQQTAPSADQQIEKMMTNLTTTCHLTPEQVTKAKPIVTEFVNARIANKEKYGKDKEKFVEANKTGKATMNTKLNAILNAEQQKELAAKEKEMTEKAAKAKATKASDNK